MTIALAKSKRRNSRKKRIQESAWYNFIYNEVLLDDESPAFEKRIFILRNQ
jgi:hypothetical protein